MPFKMDALVNLMNYFCRVVSSNFPNDTVDGSEIRRSPVEVGSLSHGFQPSTVTYKGHQAGDPM